MTTEAEYKRLYEDLLEQAKSDGWTVTYVGNSKLLDYQGMNPEAAKEMGYTPEIGKREIHMQRSCKTWKHKYQLLWHELFEVHRMERGESYWDAHRKSLAEEAKL
jgi:hypothetical protein